MQNLLAPLLAFVLTFAPLAAAGLLAEAGSTPERRPYDTSELHRRPYGAPAVKGPVRR